MAKVWDIEARKCWLVSTFLPQRHPSCFYQIFTFVIWRLDYTMLILSLFYPHFFHNYNIGVKPTYSTHFFNFFLNFSMQMIGRLNHLWLNISHFFPSIFSHYLIKNIVFFSVKFSKLLKKSISFFSNVFHII